MVMSGSIEIPNTPTLIDTPTASPDRWGRAYMGMATSCSYYWFHVSLQKDDLPPPSSSLCRRLAAMHERGIVNLSEGEFVHKSQVPRLAIRQRPTSNLSPWVLPFPWPRRALLGKREITTLVWQITTLVLLICSSLKRHHQQLVLTQRSSVPFTCIAKPTTPPPSHDPLPGLQLPG